MPDKTPDTSIRPSQDGVRVAAPASPGAPAAGAPTRPRTDHNAEWDADDDERPDGDPADVKDAGPLESLGRAISSPVREASRDAPVSDRSPRKP